MKVDCHCHILPGLDDGAQTLEDSVGTRTVDGVPFHPGDLAGCQSRELASSLVHDPTKIGNRIPLAEAKWLIGEGYQPVLAHPERYLFLQMDDYKAFKDAGVQFQRNMGTLEGMYGDEVKVRAEALQAEDYVFNAHPVKITLTQWYSEGATD